MIGKSTGDSELRRLIGPAVESIDDPDDLRDLLQAVLEVGSGLDLEITLQKIVDVAARVLDATYGALGVRGPDNDLSAFVYTGLTPAQRERMGRLPVGRGILGEVLTHPQVQRIDRIGEHPASVGFPPNHPPMSTFLGAPILIRGDVFGSIYLTEKRAGARFTERDESVILVMSAAAAIAVDNARLFRAAQTRHRWMQLVAKRGSEPLAGIALADTLTHICSDVSALTGAQDVVILTVDDERGTVIGHAGSPVDEVIRIPSDVVGDEPIAVLPADSIEYFGADPQVRWLTVLQLTRASGPFGLLVSTHVDKPHWRPEENAGMAAVAEVTSLAVVYADQQSLARDMELLSDRHRIARDLHDHVIQRLFATGMSLQTTLAALPEDAPVATSIEQVVGDLDRTIEEIRTAIFDLNSGAKNAQNTSTTLRRRVLDTVTELAARAQNAPTVRFRGPVDTLVPAALGPHIDAVLREGLSNALRHAHARYIEVTVAADDVLSLEIADDGVGIPSDAQYSGLGNLSQRAEECDGTFTVSSSLSGTVLLWEVPLYT
ncbi:GAF domain-containing sensor histidine kinase [Gordonia jinhuaensis]|nr:GAF domain-containing protein [Gordonia jinhuaensis]